MGVRLKLNRFRVFDSIIIKIKLLAMKNQNHLKSIVLSIVCILIAVPVTLVSVELALRLKNLSMKNYEIEMWRYARELKTLSQDPTLGHIHRPSASALLQSVEIRTNELGLRGPSIPAAKGLPTILFLGSSITLGWGVPEADTVVAQTQKLLKKDGIEAVVLNAGVGNYNSQRYVNLFLSKLKQIEPTDIVVHFFLRDAEILEAPRSNWFLKNSQLAVTLWNLYQQSAMAKKGVTVESKYREIYNYNHPGYQEMVAALTKLSVYAQSHNIRAYLAVTPDVHNLKQYPFSFIHEEMGRLSKKLGYHFVDLYPSLQGLTPEQVWSMPGDPHPNSLGHLKMAEAIVPVLEKEITSSNHTNRKNIN